MKQLKRILSFLLVLGLLLSVTPVTPLVGAAEVVQRYELDTDGIDAGATYLIINTATEGSGNALRFYYSNIWNRDFQNQTLNIHTDENGVRYVNTGFTNEADCQFTFNAGTAGQIQHGNYTVDLENSRFASGNSNTLTFTNAGNGAYRIHYTAWWTTYYLRYSNSDWARSTSQSDVYLFKLVEYVVGYDVTYDGNGHTSGTLPQNATELENGTTYTVLAPESELRMDVGEDTWLFQCWNTAPDGSGTEYAIGDTITVTEDVTLYAQWYLQTKYMVNMLTYLDGTPTDVDQITGTDTTFYAQLENSDGPFIHLTKRADGTYGAKVVDNGVYVIYSKTGDGDYEPVHGHKVVIYNADGRTECQHFTVSYDAAGGTWAEGEMPTSSIYLFGDAVVATDKIPSLEGNRFLYWLDQDGNRVDPGAAVTTAVDRKITLTAQWEKTVSVTVNVYIDHVPSSTQGHDKTATKDDIILQLMRIDENGYRYPMDTLVLTPDSHGNYLHTSDENGHFCSYVLPAGTATFTDLPRNQYTVAVSKRHYEETITTSTDEEGNVTVTVSLKYVPTNFDLDFDVVVENWESIPQHLRPQALNLRVSAWYYITPDELGWAAISQLDNSYPPIAVPLDPATGTGAGFYTVWKYWSSDDGIDHPYYYRVLVDSYIMPNGTVVPAQSDDDILYTASIYNGTVTITPGAGLPDYPDGSDGLTDLTGSRYDTNTDQQDSTPIVTVQVTPFTVTFDAGEGTLDGQSTLVLDNRYQYPDLSTYTPVPNDPTKVFIGWFDADGNPAVNRAGEIMMDGDVTYYAKYNDNITLSGTVSADASYQQDGETVYIHDIDRAENIMVVLQKKVGDVYNDINSTAVKLTYEKNEDGKFTVGIGSYEFTDLPNDGTEYRVYLLVRNYTGTYDNNQDDVYTEQEGVALFDIFHSEPQVDIHLNFAPDQYQQAIRVDASQIHEDLRPSGVLAQILYRDLGNVHNYQVISQHTVDPFGVMVNLDPAKATGWSLYNVWNWHTNGSLYEYQVQISKLYGNNVTGAYTADGTPFTADSPFTIEYGPSNNYYNQTLQQGVMLTATLVPKQYSVFLDLNLGDDTDTPVLGLESYMIDDGTDYDRYAYLHTWSYPDHFTAFPYREGYVFDGWTCEDDDHVMVDNGGNIHIGATLAENITLKAQWTPMEGTDYTVRHLELNTDKVLHGAQAISGAQAGSAVVAADKTLSLDGYVYAGALVNGTYLDKTENPVMTVSNDPLKNTMVIYYLPDGSDGYTEQVESNLDINKYAVLEDDGTYTITFDTYTMDNPITTLIEQNTPLDIVLVLDQSGSLQANDYAGLNALKNAVATFVETIADHGRHNDVDHRIALVGFACHETDIPSNESYPYTGQGFITNEADRPTSWINTGVFDSNGEFHRYNIKGFRYTELENPDMNPDNVYYTKVTVDGEDKYLLLSYHSEYRHLIDEESARVALLNGQTIYGYVYNEQNVGNFVELTRNSSGLWLYGNRQLYSSPEFFTYHTDVWTYRNALEPRQIHAYGTGSNYKPVDGHEGVYTRTETTESAFEQSIYVDALIPVSVGANGSGGTNPGLLQATSVFGANGATRSSYGMEMANKILAENPVDPEEGRVRFVIMFTDGEPGFMGFDASSGQSYYDQAVTEANNAIAQAYIAKNTHDAYVYAIGLYESAGVDATSEVAYYMNALSSNYPNAKNMDDIKAESTYTTAENGTLLEANGKFFVLSNGNYYEVQYGYVRVSGSYWSQYCWYYKRNNTNYSITTATNPTVSNGKVNGTTIYQRTGGYAATDHSGYYATTESADQLQGYFENVLRDITTKITTEIVLNPDTILRDIMNQGLVLTDGTVITAYTQKGIYNMETGKIVWDVDANGQPVLNEQVSLTVGSGQTSVRNDESGVTINVYNLDAENPTDPNKENYHPHTVEVTGYDFYNWYISEDHMEGYKLITTITRVEARDDVQWGRSTTTNNEQSGLWLPADAFGNRQLLLPFDQPTTIFVERAYVLDYGKAFTLSGWYFDDEEVGAQRPATPVHVDCNIEDGMNWFDENNPNTYNDADSPYGNTKYGNVQVRDGKVTYTPTSMNWGSYDQFYVFGDTWRKTVLSQDANENGNLWNKVTVIPANNIYYEDSFLTADAPTGNGIEGFKFEGDWQIVETDNPGQNTEVPEHMENAPYGDVHGWTDSLVDDFTFTDGSVHGTGFDGTIGASAEFTFTGTGVDVYTFTNAKSGMVVAVLKRLTTAGDGTQSSQLVKSIAIDNLAVSNGEDGYYHIPTVSFQELVYGTYSVQLIATAASIATDQTRYEYYIDGVRVYNPLGSTTNYTSNIVKDAYGLETNAVFTEIRDVLLEYGDFNPGLEDSDDGKVGAVFIDWIQEDQGTGDDPIGTGVPSYQVGTFETYGPKNEVYLSSGQAIVLKVDVANIYYVGLKSLTGQPVKAYVSGIDDAYEPQIIELSHSTDLYYRVTPLDGYIVIQNGSTDHSVLSITKLRTTNLTEPAANGGILPVEQQAAVQLTTRFHQYMQLVEAAEPEPQPPVDETPEEDLPSAEQQAAENERMAQSLFTSVRTWLETE